MGQRLDFDDDGHAIFHSLVEELAEAVEPRLALAALNDFLSSVTSKQFAAAVSEANLQGLSPFLANYVAGMVEEAAEKHSMPAPPWIAGVEPLNEPYFASRHPTVQSYLRHQSPRPFRARNIFIDATIGDRV